MDVFHYVDNKSKKVNGDNFDDVRENLGFRSLDVDFRHPPSLEMYKRVG